VGRVKPELRSLFSLETPDDLRSYEPEDPECFGLRVMAMIGASASPNPEASDAFDFIVCTPRWLDELNDLSEISHQKGAVSAFGRGLLIVHRWDYNVVERAVVERCDAAEAPDWATAFARLSRDIPGEFEYRYDDEIDRGEDPASP
jgi:hypothetical protein